MTYAASEQVGASLREHARRAQDLAPGHPRLARSQAEAVLREARAAGDGVAVAMAAHALGTAALVLGDLTEAETSLRSAASQARRSRQHALEGLSRNSLAMVLMTLGRTADALAEVGRAEPLLHGPDLALLHGKRALILQRMGDHRAALAGYAAALAGLPAGGAYLDHQAKLLSNRGILHTYLGDLDGAEADLSQAHTLFAGLGLDMDRAEVVHNLGFVAAQRGDIPGALNHYERADNDFRRLGVRRPAALLDRCQALLTVGLVSEARGLARAAAGVLADAHEEVDLAEARLVMAEAAMAEGDSAEAIELAALARLAFVSQRRNGWAVLARYVFLRASWQAGHAPTEVEVVRTMARELEASGWVLQAADARVIAARVALKGGRRQSAQADLERVSRARRHGPAGLRARAWYAEALLRLERGDRRAALAALRRGVGVIDAHRATLGATELRAHSAAAAAELVTMGLGLALETKRPASVLSWAERFRATSMRIPSARPPADPAVAAKLTQLRQIAGEVQEAALAGQPTDALLRQQAIVEGSIRRLARTAPGLHGIETPPPPSVASLARALGAEALVEYVSFAGVLWAVTVVDGHTRLWQLGDVSRACAEVEQLRFALTRLVSGRREPRLAQVAAESMDDAARGLDDLLFGAMSRALGDRARVVVPTGILHSVPWAVLPSNRGRPVTVAPSAAQWLAARGAARGQAKRALLVAGPEVAQAELEVSALSSLYHEPVRLQSRKATVARTLEALGECDLAHLAAHGRFRADNPLFSSIELADGPLTVYDLESAGRVPPTIVLSACDGNRAAVELGDELLGLASALVGMGASTVVGSPIIVPDVPTRELMLAFHIRLPKMGPAAALAEAQAVVLEHLRSDRSEAAAAAAVSGFACFGAG